MINIIVAVDEQFGFGKDGKIPWHFPEDFKFFQTKTKGHTVIMGRHTYEDMLSYFKADNFLPGRECIVVTSQDLPNPYTNVTFVKCISEATKLAKCKQGDTFFIGGEQIFKSALQLADCVYLTVVPGNYGCDRFFPHEDLKNGYHVFERREGSDGLKFYTYIHNVWGGKEVQ